MKSKYFIAVVLVSLFTMPLSGFGQDSHNSKFDFVPGNQVLFTENFEQDVLDEFPLNWYTNNNGKTIELEGIEGKWMKMYHSSQFLSPVLASALPENFTLEFDMILSFKNDGYIYPEFYFSLIENIKDDRDGRKYMNEHRDLSTISSLDFALFAGEGQQSFLSFQSNKTGDLYFKNEGVSLPNLPAQFGKRIHISLWVQKKRLRIWFDKTKVFDMPQAVPEGIALNRLAMKITSTIQPPEDILFYVSNFRFATAGADLRTKLMQDGKFSTQGIVFDVNSDKIKPSSDPILKEIAGILKENGSLRIRIIGHTDSDGNDQENLELSKRRAAAVKRALTHSYAIAEHLLETDGQGESNPVADNGTEDGKAKNRRVEFIKL